MQKANLDDVKQSGFGGILQEYLHSLWTKQFGFDIKVIDRDARQFRRWLETVSANALFNVNYSNTHTTGIHEGLHLKEVEWLVHEASVRYQIDFCDGSRAWLNDIVEADISDIQSLRDFDEIVRSHKPPEPPPWHSKGFGVIWRRNRNGDQVGELPLSNEFRALCQLLAERPEQASQFSEIELKIGTRTRELDHAGGQTDSASAVGKRRIRDMLRTQTGKQLVDWKVLTETEVGREKFIKLSPPAVAE